MSYLDLSYRPDKDLVCEFYLEPAKGLSVKEAAEHVAGESSVGTWTEVSTSTPRIRKMAAKVFSISDGRRQETPSVQMKGNHVKIAYPMELFEPGNMPQILSSIAGNIFGMKAIENLRLLDMDFPKEIARSFKGPEIGLEDLRGITGIKGRPILGTIFKPKLGLNPKEMEELAYKVYSAGLDYTKDDENLTSMSFNKFEDRVSKVLGVADKIKSEQGRTVVYAANITSPSHEMLKRAQFVRDHGGKCIMIDIMTAGWSGLQYIREQNLGLIIHAHRAMHAAFTRNPKHGISMLAIAKAARLCGVTALHAGTVVGKMEGPKEEVVEIDKFLKSDFYGLKKVMPIASGGLHPRLVPDLLKILGTDLVITFGGGLWGHPGGPESGVRAIKQSADSFMQKIPVQEYAKTHKDLAEALKIWK
jgi:ribulose-bisphosphate carboxylase large chain